MKNPLYLFLAVFCIFSQACHRPVAYFQRTPYVSARTPVATPPAPATDSLRAVATSVIDTLVTDEPFVASVAQPHVADPVSDRLERRALRMQSLLTTSTASPTADQQPRPKPKPKQQLRLGNRIRESLGIPLRDELNWWQRISWKLKAAFVVILIALVFALLKITLLAVIFGIVGAFLLISGLRRSFKTRRPWF